MRTRLTRTPCPSRLCAKLTRPSPAPTSPHPNTRNRPFYPTTRRRRLLLGQLGTTTSKKHRDKKRLPIGRHCDDSRAPVRPESAISACPETTFLKMCRSQPAPSWHPVAKGALLILDHISHVSRGESVHRVQAAPTEARRSQWKEEKRDSVLVTEPCEDLAASSSNALDSLLPPPQTTPAPAYLQQAVSTKVEVSWHMSVIQNLHLFHPFAGTTKDGDLPPAATEESGYPCGNSSQQEDPYHCPRDQIAGGCAKKKLLKVFKKKFACSGPVVEHPGMRKQFSYMLTSTRTYTSS
ncbi:uncharacterized protein LOC121825697 [Peromyscus maniculatus bairdii]|uniref:uncharacterized protein LOC121825697 n=1 Tax=Peromyscus maniculatus bairdii TaxID=230844 RepID=UPI003FD51933